MIRYQAVLDLVRQGRESGFPRCCSLRYALSSGDQAFRRGIRFNADETPTPYVPCLVFHWAMLTHAQFERLLALAKESA